MILGFIFTWGVMAGCLPTAKKSASVAPGPPKAPSAPAPAPCPPDPSAELREENAALHKKLADSQAQLVELNSMISKSSLRLLEFESLTKELERRVESQQQRLEAAIVEVVRTKSKLRSIESKAEAASTLAEAEIAMKEFKGRISGLDKSASEELVAVDQLLKMSAAAFKDQNYGGALYLANQSKTRVRAIHTLQNKIPEGAVASGETAFSKPLTLKVLKKSNIRQGPGLKENVIVLLDPGVLVTGYGYKDSWVRVETQGGTVGWIFRELIAAP